LPTKQGSEEVGDGQHLLGLITDVEELLLILSNFYGNQRLRFQISLKSQ
jgi:hypothetical protein